MWRRGSPLLVAAALTVVSACGNDAAGAPAARDAADSAFISDMLVHHARALELGHLAGARGTDPRVRAFGERIVREQTPEHSHLEAWVRTLGVRVDPMTDAAMASGYVTDSSYTALQKLSGAAFDKQVLLLSASSEDGAVEMAQTELAGGKYEPALALARSINGAKGTEIPELRKLAAQL